MGRIGWLVAALFAIVLAVLLTSDGTVGGLTDFEFARLGKLVILVLIVGVFTRGVLFAAPASTNARNALLWVGIVGVLMVGYAYREEAQHIAHRVSLGLVPGSSVTRIADDGTARVQIGRDRVGHYSVDGKVDGVDVRFLVDTGASTIALSAEDARRVGFDPDELRYTQPINTANGRAFAAPVTLDVVSIGGIERRRVAASVSPPGALSQSLLGMNFVGTLSSFTIRGDRLILTD